MKRLIYHNSFFKIKKTESENRNRRNRIYIQKKIFEYDLLKYSLIRKRLDLIKIIKIINFF
jgi:hypothetical protein